MHWRQVHDPDDRNYLPMDRLTYCFASHLLGLCKPSDAIYEHVEKVTGFPPRSILFFDDIEANIAGAMKRGWRGVVVRRDSDPIHQARQDLVRFGLLTD